MRLTAAQKAVIEQAAHEDALEPAAWVRSLAVRVAEARRG